MKRHCPVEMKNESSRKAVIFLHGFMGSPDNFGAFIPTVFDSGFSCYSLLLPGHGCTVREYSKTNAEMWEKHLQNEIDRIKEDCDKIYFVTHSMGGLLALSASKNKDNKIAGVFMLAPPMKINLFRPSSIYKKLRLLLLPRKHAEIIAYRKFTGVKYNFFNLLLFTKPIINFFKIVRKTKKRLSEVTASVCMIHSKNDETVALKSAKILCTGMVNAKCETVTLKKSCHAFFPKDEEKIVLEKLLEFIESN